MPTVASVDYPNKRIYLSVDTVNADLDTITVYQEVVALRVANASHRLYPAMIEAGGNLPKVTGVTYTPRYARLLNGCRIVPYDTSHRIRLTRDTFTDDGFAGRDCFDRTPLSASVEVDIDVDVQEVEVRVVTIASGSVITGDIADVPTAAEVVAALKADQTFKALCAPVIGEQGGAGTPVATYTYNGVTVTADVPLPGVVGNRTNVQITGT